MGGTVGGWYDSLEDKVKQAAKGAEKIAKDVIDHPIENLATMGAYSGTKLGIQTAGKAAGWVYDEFSNAMGDDPSGATEQASSAVSNAQNEDSNLKARQIFTSGGEQGENINDALIWGSGASRRRMTSWS